MVNREGGQCAHRNAHRPWRSPRPPHARDDALTCQVDDAVDDVLERLAASPYGLALVLSRDGVLLGAIRRDDLPANNE